MSTVQEQDVSCTRRLIGTRTVTITPGSHTVWGNQNGWPEAVPITLSPEQAANYYYDMFAALDPVPGQVPTAPFQTEVEIEALVVQFPGIAPVVMSDVPLSPEQQAALLAQPAGQVQQTPAPHAAPPQSVGQPMAPTQQVVPSTFAPGQTNWQQMPALAAPAQVGQNVVASRAIAEPARGFHAHRVPGPVPSNLLRTQTAAPPVVVDLTGEDDAEAGPSTPTPQHAGTKRARADSTPAAAAPKAKKPKKEKKVKKAKQPRIPNSGLRVQPVVVAAAPAAADAAATTVAPPSDNTITTTPVQGETPAVEQQQHQSSPPRPLLPPNPSIPLWWDSEVTSLMLLVSPLWRK